MFRCFSFSHRRAQRSSIRGGSKAPCAQDEAPPDPHRLHAGTAADARAQLPKVPLPVGAGAAHHRLSAAPLRDSGENLVPEPAHQVEKGAAAGEGASGTGTQLRGAFSNAARSHSTTRLRSTLLPPAAAAAAAARTDSGVCAPATGTVSPLLQMMCEETRNVMEDKAFQRHRL